MHFRSELMEAQTKKEVMQTERNGGFNKKTFEYRMTMDWLYVLKKENQGLQNFAVTGGHFLDGQMEEGEATLKSRNMVQLRL